MGHPAERRTAPQPRRLHGHPPYARPEPPSPPVPRACRSHTQTANDVIPRTADTAGAGAGRMRIATGGETALPHTPVESRTFWCIASGTSSVSLPDADHVRHR